MLSCDYHMVSRISNSKFSGRFGPMRTSLVVFCFLQKLTSPKNKKLIPRPGIITCCVNIMVQKFEIWEFMKPCGELLIHYGTYD